MTKTSALDFLRITWDAIPRSLGDRDRIAAMTNAMNLAIDTGMSFRSGDEKEMGRIAITTCVGLFHPLSEEFYRRSCIAGGTYSRFYESATGHKPWYGQRVFRSTWAYAQFMSEQERTARNAVVPSFDDPVPLPCALTTYRQPEPWAVDTRIAPSFGVLLPMTPEWDDPALAHYQGGAYFVCTSMHNSQMVLARYPHRDHLEHMQTGRPVKLLKFSREEWTERFPRPAAEPRGETGPAEPEPSRRRETERAAA